MKDLAGTNVVANIKIRDPPRSDVNAPIAFSHTSKQGRRNDDSDRRHNAFRRSLSVETEGEQHEAQSNITHRLERQEGDIIIVLQNLQALQKEMRSFKKDFDALKTATDDMTAQQNEQSNAVLTEDLELLTESVSDVSSKLGEVDSLKLEMKMMQSRLKRLEEEKRGHPTAMAPPPTPRSTNGVRPVQSYNKTQERPFGNKSSTPHASAFTSSVESALDRARAASVQRDFPQTPKASHVDRARAASVQCDLKYQSHNRSEMPPPEIPNHAASRSAPDLRSASETPRNVRGQSNLHNAISVLNESANEFPEVVEDSDEEYDDQGPSPDVEDENRRPRRARHSLPTRKVSNGVDGDYEGNPQKRRRTTSHALTAEPSPPPGDPAYQSLWATATDAEGETSMNSQRNANGFMLKTNGEVDKRSLRFLGKNKKRRSLHKNAMRDDDGYLLNADGSRNERSVSIIDGMKKREKERGESMAPAPN